MPKRNMNKHKEYFGYLDKKVGKPPPKLKYAEDNLYSHVVGIILYYVSQKKKLSRRNKLCRIKLLIRIFGCTDFGSGCNAKQCAFSQIILLPYTKQKTHLRVPSASLKFQAFSCIKIAFCSHSFRKHACKLFKWHFNVQGHLM